MLLSMRLAANYAALFWTLGIYLPFLPAWLEGRGLSGEQIGLVLAASMWAKVPASTLLTGLADATGRRKRVLVAITASVLIGFAAFLFIERLWLVAVLCSLVGAAFTTVIPLSDNVTILVARRHGIDFGRVRLWGSLAFVVASVGGGGYLVGRPPESILILLIAGAAAMLVAALQVPETLTPPRSGRRPALLEVLKLKGFKVFVATVSLLLASHAGLYGFATLRWQAAGIGDDIIGLLWAEGVIAEIVVFAMARRLVGRFRVSTLLLLAALAAVVRWTALGLTTDLAALALLQVLHAMTFSVTYIAAQTYILGHVPDDQSASAQGLLDALSMGLLLGLAMLAAGWAFETAHGLAFLAMVPMAGLAAVAAVALRRYC